MKSPTIISLGGSLVVPDAIDSEFLSGFKELLAGQVKDGKEFVVVLGGGKTARRYQGAGKEVSDLSSDELDWLGIYSIQLNAEFVRIIFQTLAHPKVITQSSSLKDVRQPIAVAGAEEPGHSSDFDAVEMARETGSKQIVNLSNIDYVYDSDPKKNPAAKKIERISWAAFRKIIPAEWSPGVNAPFDPVAAKRAEELGLEVAIMNGKPLENLANYLSGKAFKGKVISS